MRLRTAARLAVLFALVGVGLPGAVLAVGWPEWHTNFLLHFRGTSLTLGMASVLVVVAAAAVGHALGSLGRPGSVVVPPRVIPLMQP